MTTKKKPVPRRKAKRLDVASPIASTGEKMWVLLPLPAAAVASLREHAANAAKIRDLVTGRESATIDDMIALCKSAVAAIDRDVRRLKR